MSSLDGLQSAGLQGNTIDGLTNVNTTALYINGVLFTPSSYVPYTGATTNVDLNAKQLKNILDPTLAQDASTKNYTDTQVLTKVPYSGATTNVDLNAKQLKNIANGSASQDAVSYSQLTSYTPTQIVNGFVSVVCGTNDITNTTSTSGTIISNIGNGGILVNYNNGWYQSLTTSFPISTRTWGINVASPNAIEFTHTASGGGVVGFFNFTRKVKIQPISNSTDVLTIANTAGTTIFSVDTSTPAINANSNKITNLAVATAQTDAVNYSQMYKLLKTGTNSTAYISGDDVILDAWNSGAVWAYYGGNPKFVVGSSGHEVYVADTGFSWLKGSVSGTSMYKISATSTTQTIIDVSNDNLLTRTCQIIKPYSTTTEPLATLTIKNVNDTLICASFYTGNTITNNYLDMNNNKIINVGDAITTYGAVNLNQMNIATATVATNLSVSYNPLPNLIRNGDMLINQKASTSVPDGWISNVLNPYVSIAIVNITDLAGYSKALRFETSPSASSLLVSTYQRIEGTFFKALNYGYTTGVGATVSLWAKSDIASHKIAVSLYIVITSTTGYECCSTFTLPATTGVWTRVSVFFPSQSAYIPSSSNITSAYISITAGVAGGGSYGNGVEGVFGTTTTTTRRLGLADGSTNQMNTAVIKDVYFTGIQMDAGSFVYPVRSNCLSYQDQLNMCWRYYYRLDGEDADGVGHDCALYSTTHYLIRPLPIRMRIAPVCGASSNTIFRCWTPQTGSNNTSTSIINHATSSVDSMGFEIGLSAYQGYSCLVVFNSTSYIYADAELS